MVSGTRLAGPPGPMPRFKSLVFKDSIRDEPRSGKKKKAKKIRGFYQGEIFVPLEDYSTDSHWNFGTNWVYKTSRKKIRAHVKNIAYEKYTFGRGAIELNPIIEENKNYLNVKYIFEKIFRRAYCSIEVDKGIEHYYLDKTPGHPTIDLIIFHLPQSDLTKEETLDELESRKDYIGYYQLKNSSLSMSVIFKPKRGSDIEGLFMPFYNQGLIIPREKHLGNKIATGLEDAYAHLFTVHKRKELKSHHLFKYYNVYSNEDGLERGLLKAINNRGLKQ